MMPRVLRCDLEGLRQLLHQLESDTSSELISLHSRNINLANKRRLRGNIKIGFISEQQILAIMQERCDGNRNILHACVHMCAPTSNKEPDVG